MKLSSIAAVLALFPCALACSAATNQGNAGLNTVQHPDVQTIYTIVFENEAADAVLTPSNPTFYALSQQYGTAQAYVSSTHPSLPNYIMMTSGSPNGFTDDNDPAASVSLTGRDNLADQLDDNKIQWRAYMETMGTACKMSSSGNYSAHHDPFLYYADMASNVPRCNQHIVDFDENFANDLKSNIYRYMWITPNMCNDMHSCDSSIADAWLKKTVAQIQASDGYKSGGAIFILFDEGSSRLPGASADLPVFVVSEKLKTMGLKTQTHFDHASYLATVEDILNLPRLPATNNATAMDELFKPLVQPLQ